MLTVPTKRGRDEWAIGTTLPAFRKEKKQPEQKNGEEGMNGLIDLPELHNQGAKP